MRAGDIGCVTHVRQAAGHAARSLAPCRGSIIDFVRDDTGAIVRDAGTAHPVLDPTTWRNSGIGRLNPDGEVQGGSDDAGRRRAST